VVKRTSRGGRILDVRIDEEGLGSRRGKRRGLSCISVGARRRIIGSMICKN